jgi:flagellar hook-associated protein 1 FlgK
VFDPDSSRINVGKLSLTTPSGLTIDLVGQGVLQGGELAGLIALRDKTLVEAQDQLDEIAAGLALAFSTVSKPGIAVEDGDARGLMLDITDMVPGNDIVLTFSQGGVDQRVRIVNTAQTTDYVDATGQRVIGLDFSVGGADLANSLNDMFPGLNISGGPGHMRILDDGSAGVTDVKTAVARSTSNGLQGSGLAFNLFVDQGNQTFTNNLDTHPPQKRGFAARIAINPAILADNRLLVQHEVDGTLGNADRANYVIDQLQKMTFVSGTSPAANSGRFQLAGNLGEVISQVVGFQGANINATLTKRDDRQLTLDTIIDQMDEQYGVNVDEEMARLLELQNAYAANARIVSVVKELLDTLFSAT